MQAFFILLAVAAGILVAVFGIQWLMVISTKKAHGPQGYGRNAFIAFAVLALSILIFDFLGTRQMEAERDNLLVLNDELEFENREIAAEKNDLETKYNELQSDWNDKKNELALLSEENTTNKELIEEMTVKMAENENAADELKKQKETFNQEKEGLTENISALEKQLADAQAENDALIDTISGLTAQAEDSTPQVSNEPSTAAAAPASSTASVEYDNCTAAREDGAAPVYRGDPGYGKHLDRDGDGVGCE